MNDEENTLQEQWQQVHSSSERVGPGDVQTGSAHGSKKELIASAHFKKQCARGR